MTSLDIAVLAILALCMGVGYLRGLIMTLFRLISFFVSLILAGLLYPVVSKLLRLTPLFDALKNAVIEAMGLEEMIQTYTPQIDLFGNLPLPDLLRESLQQFNTPNIYELLHVATLEEYIAGFFANLAINIISMLLVFILVWVLMRAIGNALNIVGRLPVISTFNRVGGLAAGLCMGILFVWIGLALMHLLFINPSHPEIFDLLNRSFITRFFYNHNWLMPMITQI